MREYVERFRAMRHTAFWMLGLVMAVLFLPSAAMAEGCKDIAAGIAKMDAASVKPPGYFSMRNSLITSAIFCETRPALQSEYWYRLDGSATGIRADQGHPKDAAFSTTPEIAATCMRNDPKNPSTCAMLIGARKACAAPQEADQRVLCIDLFGEDAMGKRSASETNQMPDTVVSLDGRSFKLPFMCQDVMSRIGDNPDFAPSSYSAEVMQRNCPEFLAALQQRIGTSPQQNPTAFWKGFGDLILSNFPPRGAPPVSVAGIAADPGFRRMCAQAEQFQNQCRINQGKMGEVGTISKSTALQAGDFNDCANVYGGVLKMCGRTTAAAAASSQTASAAPPKPAAPPPACPAGMKPTSDGYCVSANQNYCGSGMKCDDGLACKTGGRCFYSNDCFPEEVKIGGKCFAAGKVYCSNGTYCEPGGSCNPAGGCKYPPGGGPSFTGPDCGGWRAPAGHSCAPAGYYYDPATTKICGTTTCDLRKECGNNECLSPFHQTQAVRQGGGQAR